MAGRFIDVCCMQCIQDYVQAGKLPTSKFYKLHNTNYKKHIEFRCENGHHNVIVIQELLFETLLNMAVEDFVDKYYRESILNFASALERCFEFVIEILFNEKCIEGKEFKYLWNFMEKQSERQLGAFCSMFLCRFGISPFNYSNFRDMACIRNRVVHKGEFALEDDARKYGEFVIRTIYNIIKCVIENIEYKLLYEFETNKIQEYINKKGSLPQGANIITVSDRLLSWRIATEDELEKERLLGEFSRKYPKEYADMACKANTENKVLDINEMGELILVDAKELFVIENGVRYIGSNDLDDYINVVLEKRKIRELI